MTVNATSFRKNLFDILKRAVVYNETISISTKEGNAVVISESDYNDMMETLYLLNIPGMRERLVNAANEPIEESEDFEW